MPGLWFLSLGQQERPKQWERIFEHRGAFESTIPVRLLAHWRGGMAATAPWRKLLLDSLQCNEKLRHSSFFQLVIPPEATVRENGTPAVRTVVFRDFLEGTDKLQFTTDARSQKIQEIKCRPLGEICWYFTDSREQFRISGVLDVIESLESDPERRSIRDRAWHKSSPNSRLQFAQPFPGIPCAEGGIGPVELDDTSEGPLDTFCLVTFDPLEVDYLHLKQNRRWLFKKDESLQWNQQEVVP